MHIITINLADIQLIMFISLSFDVEFDYGPSLRFNSRKYAIDADHSFSLFIQFSFPFTIFRVFTCAGFVAYQRSRVEFTYYLIPFRHRFSFTVVVVVADFTHELITK